MVDTRWIETVQIIVLFCLLGISIAMLGPSLPDLAFNTESSIKQYTVIFFGRATGSFLGSWVSGWLIDNYHHTFFLPFVILGHAAFYICIPLTGQLVIVALCISLSGLTSSTIATVGNVALFDIWSAKEERKKQGSIVQAAHGMYAFGGVLSAPIANHFLGVFETPLANNSSMISNSTGCAKEDSNSTVIRLEEDNLTTLFTIVCSTLAVLAISIFIFWKLSDRPASKRSSGGEAKPEVVLIKEEKILAFLLFLFMIGCVGAEVTYTQFLFTYAQRTLQLSREKCTLLVTTFWICFCLFRTLAIFISRLASPRVILTCNLSACCASSIILWLSPNIYLTWFSVGLFAAGLSSTYPTAFSFAQKFVTISGKFASRFAIGGAIGWMTIPSIAGYFFERYCKSMPLIVFISMSINVCLLLLMNYQGRQITRVKNQNDPEKTELKSDKNESEILVTGQEKSEN